MQSVIQMDLKKENIGITDLVVQYSKAFGYCSQIKESYMYTSFNWFIQDHEVPFKGDYLIQIWIINYNDISFN